MNRYTFAKNIDWLDNPGTWYQYKDGKEKPYISCPKCGLANLGPSATHSVSKTGEVNASVVCGHPPCDFHEFIFLEDYDGEEFEHES